MPRIKIKQRLQSALALGVALLFLASVPAFADHGGSSGMSDSNEAAVATTGSSGTDSSSADTNSELQSKTEAETAAQNESGTNEAELHQMGIQMMSEMAKNHKAKSAADIQKACTAHKQGLQTKFNAIVTNSQRIQNKIDDIFSKAQAYQQTNNLSPANWSSLVSAAQNAQTTSNAAIAALKDVTPTLDCNNVSVASDVATFKAAAQTTRTDLKAYRTAVKNVLQALQNSKKASTSGGSAQ